MTPSSREPATPPAYPLEIFYDGSCIVCSREIDHYRRNNPAGRLIFIDISAAGFDSRPYRKSDHEFQSKMHVRDAEGSYLAGVDAFLAIWGAYPDGSSYRWLARIISLPVVTPMVRVGYALFARYRHLLPKRRHDCAEDRCERN